MDCLIPSDKDMTFCFATVFTYILFFLQTKSRRDKIFIPTVKNKKRKTVFAGFRQLNDR